MTKLASAANQSINLWKGSKGSGQGCQATEGGVAKFDRSLATGISTLCTLSRYHSHLQHMNAIFRVSKWDAEHCSWCEGQYSGHGTEYWICRSSRRYRPRAARSPPLREALCAEHGSTVRSHPCCSNWGQRARHLPKSLCVWWSVPHAARPKPFCISGGLSRVRLPPLMG